MVKLDRSDEERTDEATPLGERRRGAEAFDVVFEAIDPHHPELGIDIIGGTL